MTGADVRAELDPSYFDGLSPDYDSQFSHRLCGRWLRELVHERADAVIAADAKVLEIGCGTGEDALHFANRGCRVMATDASQEMLHRCRAKVIQSEQADRVTCIAWDANTAPPAELAMDQPFDALFSNFGAVNCLTLDQTFAERAAALLRPSGMLVLVVMGPLCPWETLWFGLRGQLGNAFRRLRRSGNRVAGDARIAVSYPSVHALTESLGRNFELQACYGIGFLLPPSFAFHWVERWPKFFAGLRRGERRLAAWWPFNRATDHYLAVFEQRAGGPESTSRRA